MGKSKILVHYTSLNNALNILKSGKFKFSALKDTDDIQESILERYYPKLSCFKSCSFAKIKKESIPMWKIYGRVDNNDGVMIKFFFNSNSLYDDLFKDEEVKCSEIKYVKSNLYNRYVAGLGKGTENFEDGFAKSSCWNFEKEFRYGIYFSEAECFLKINFNALKKIQVILFPTINSKTNQIKKKMLKKEELPEGLYDKIEFHKSSLLKTLKIKT